MTVKKLKISELKVDSFVTSIEHLDKVVAGLNPTTQCTGKMNQDGGCNTMDEICISIGPDCPSAGGTSGSDPNGGK